jgi:type IV pilus assembly protein PilB
LQNKDIHIALDLQQVLSSEQAWYYGIVPKAKEADTLHLYIDEQKWHAQLAAELQMLLGHSIVLEPIDNESLTLALSKFYRRNGQKKSTTIQNLDGKIDFLQALINEAKTLDSSDIHIESYKNQNRIRFRIDGNLIEKYSVTKVDYTTMINKIKIMAGLDIAEKRLPQDGRIQWQEAADQFDIRVSSMPTMHGEKIVMRLLQNNADKIDLRILGLDEKQLQTFYRNIEKPHGMILISGPTGSGKTTSLYSVLKHINTTTKNILTIEDPIEYTLEGINQVQLKEDIGLSFASALRTFLRQDPDVIMVGEIRDGETAQMAIRASLTGHLVFSTIHTNSSWDTVTRLIDIGIPPYIIASTLNLSVAQRLLKKLCLHCQTPLLDKAALPEFLNIAKAKTAKGCDHCFHTGYKGRMAIYEVLEISETLKEAIKNRDTNINDYLSSKKINTLAQSAIALFEAGQTSFEEIYPYLLYEDKM